MAFSSALPIVCDDGRDTGSENNWALSLCAPHSAIPTKNTAPLSNGASSMYTLGDVAGLEDFQPIGKVLAARLVVSDHVKKVGSQRPEPLPLQTTNEHGFEK
ncbi:hypothetical protein EYF80_020274 [Liparis tanakae]|uniref:Uncharacterized protein n=1 Tax=Liparis tanakae TaxID=230148 RepID=A0A4Z2HUZ0_9TELE|nr:hypothetical protein EYF80_020274 [Liparis tanakae]